MAENSFNPQADLGQSYSVQRTVPRYSLLAVAELAETTSTMCVVGTTMEVSRNGCYVNTPSTLPINTFLRVVSSRDGHLCDRKTFARYGTRKRSRAPFIGMWEGPDSQLPIIPFKLGARLL